MRTLVSELRERLQAACQRLLAEAENDAVRIGVLVARDAVLATATLDWPLQWIENVERALGKLTQLARPEDETSGVERVRRYVRVIRADILLNLPMESLPRLADAVLKAFPDRAEAVLAEAESWLGAGGNRICSLCRRTLHGDAVGAILLCPGCDRLRAPEDLPTEATLVELVRALREYGGERAEETIAEIEKNWQANRLRVVDWERCENCRSIRSAVAGRMTVCFTCLASGRIRVG